MRQFGFAAIVVGLLAVSASGQEAITIKEVHAKAGDRLKTTTTEKSTNTTTFTIGDKKQEKIDETTKSIVYVDEIIVASVGGEPHSKLVRTYEKYDVSKGAKGPVVSPPLDMPILIEKKDGKFTYTIKEKPVEKGVADLLDGEFAKSKTNLKGSDFMPKGPVKVGDTWKPDVAKLIKDLADDGKMIPDAEKSSVVCKLVSISKKDDQVYGVIEMKINIGVKGITAKENITVKSGGFAVTMTGSGCLNGTDPSDSVKGITTFTIEAETKGIVFVVEGKSERSDTKVLLPKK